MRGQDPGRVHAPRGTAQRDGDLASRLTDRPLRPLFRRVSRLDVQVVSTVLSVDQENDPTILSSTARRPRW